MCAGGKVLLSVPGKGNIWGDGWGEEREREKSFECSARKPKCWEMNKQGKEGETMKSYDEGGRGRKTERVLV